ncbi:MAG: NADPH-dependent FMN reductase [Gemmobacter sp.]
MKRTTIGIIVGSVREGRFADHPAHWIHDLTRAHPALSAELIDVRDYSLPIFAEVLAPAWGPSRHPSALRWQEKVASLDGYIMVTAEYNRGPSASLKNALDYAYREWNNKPVAFVGYGSVGGARAIEQLRLNAIELQMAPIRTAVHIPWPVYEDVQSGRNLAEFEFLNETAAELLDQLAWWAQALKAAREVALDPAPEARPLSESERLQAAE